MRAHQVSVAFVVGAMVMCVSALPMDGADRIDHTQNPNGWWLDALEQALDPPSPNAGSIARPESSASHSQTAEIPSLLSGQMTTLRWEQEKTTGSARSEYAALAPELFGSRIFHSHSRVQHLSQMEDSTARQDRDTGAYPVHIESTESQIGQPSGRFPQSESSQRSIFEHLTPLNEVTSVSSKSIRTSALAVNSPLNDARSPDDDPIYSSWRSSPSVGHHEHTSSTHDDGEEHEVTDYSDDVGTYSTVQPKRRRSSPYIAASKFLKHHPHFTEDKKDEHGPHTLAVAAERSPRASGLQKTINELLFADRLKWSAKGNHLFTSQNAEIFERQFVSRVNSRGVMYAVKDLVAFRERGFLERFVAVPQRFYKGSSTIFGSEPGSHLLLFSFWAPSSDALGPRLQFIGSATITSDEATEVIRQAYLQLRASTHLTAQLSDKHLPLPPMIVAEPRRTGSRFQASAVTGLYSSSEEWLSNLPLLERISDANLHEKLKLSSSLVSKMHEGAEELKGVANAALFGGHIVWQSQPKEAMMDMNPRGQVNVFRYHKRANVLFRTKPVMLQVLPYEMVLIPYEILSTRARLFDPSLRTQAHTFTLWAAQATPDGKSADVFDFISGGSLAMSKTAAVLQKAKLTLQHIGGAVHNL